MYAILFVWQNLEDNILHCITLWDKWTISFAEMIGKEKEVSLRHFSVVSSLIF